MKIYFLAIATLALIAAGCSKNDDTPKQDNFPADNVIRVAPSVSTITRAGTVDANLTEFALYIDNATDAAYSYSAYMEKVGTSFVSYANTVDKTPLTMLWKNKTTPVKVVAYAPYYGAGLNLNMTIESGVVTDQSTASNIKLSDFCYFCNPTFDPAIGLDQNGAIPITLKHMNAKLTITVTLGTEFNAATGGTTVSPISSVEVEGTNRTCKYNLTDGTLIPTSPTIANIKMFSESYTAGTGNTMGAKAVYECVLVPQTVAAGNFKVTMMIGDAKYTYTVPGAVTLEQDTHYALALTVGKDYVTAGGFTFTPWTENDGGSYTAD